MEEISGMKESIEKKEKDEVEEISNHVLNNNPPLFRRNLQQEDIVYNESLLVYLPLNQAQVKIAFRGEKKLEDVTKRNLSAGKYLLSLLKSRNFLLTAISGSTSYGVSSEKDDVDIFAVSKDNTLWLLITKCLLFTRIIRLVKRELPQICFSCMITESFAFSFFTSRKDPLLARDALSVKIIQGEEFYNFLLSKATWMKEFFPELYNVNFPSLQGNTKSSKVNIILRILNMFLYTTLSKYLKVRAGMFNRKLIKEKKVLSLFTPKTSISYCIYESKKYEELRKLYDIVFRIKHVY
jgi:hypothetical protein